MTRRLTIVLDDSVTEAECRDCEFGESRGIVRGRDVFSCALFDHKDVTDSRLTECLEAERAAARMVEIDPALVAEAAIDCIVPNTISADAQEAASKIESILREHARKAGR